MIIDHLLDDGGEIAAGRIVVIARNRKFDPADRSSIKHRRAFSKGSEAEERGKLGALFTQHICAADRSIDRSA